jgi:Crp-like helix-turn-helix protein
MARRTSGVALTVGVPNDVTICDDPVFVSRWVRWRSVAGRKLQGSSVGSGKSMRRSKHAPATKPTPLHAQPAFADRFLRHMLTRNIRIEEDLVDQLFNSSEKRLARTLLLLARYGEPEASHRTLPRVSQETLAEMVGTTRSRVNFFLNKFRKLGFIEYNGGLKVNTSLLSVVLRD